MLRCLKDRNKVGFVDGIVVKQTNDVVKSFNWERANGIVCLWILGSISKSIYTGHAYSKTAEEIWKELSKTYSKYDRYVVFNFHITINSLTQSGLSLLLLQQTRIHLERIRWPY